MSNDLRLFLMVFEKDDYGFLTRGTDPMDAVKGHYDEADAWCPPSDPELHEEFSVTVYEIPPDAEEWVEEMIEDLSAGEYFSTAEKLIAEYPEIKTTDVNVIYTRSGASVSLLEPLPDLFNRLG